MNLNDISKEDKETRALIGSVTQMLLNDMAETADLRVRLSEQIGYDKGFDEGYKQGYLVAQRNIRNAMFAVQFEAGMLQFPKED